MCAKSATVKPARRKVHLRKKTAGLTISVQQRKAGGARVVIHEPNGKRKSKDFPTIEAAKAYAQEREINAANAGARAATEIDAADMRVLLDAKDALKEYGKTLRDALDHYLKHLKEAKKSASVSQAIAKLMHYLRKKSDRYKGDLKSRLGKFEADFGSRMISSVTPDEIDAWLDGLDVESEVSRKNYRRILAVLFNFSARKELCPHGIMRLTSKIDLPDKTPAILTVAQTAALLLGASPRIRAGLALAAFTGIRDAELHRLDWSAVDFESGTVAIDGEVAKKKQRRTVPLRENLRAWLEPLRQLGGKVMPSTNQSRLLSEEARRNAGFGPENPWPHNCLRHGYASYRLAKWPDAAALAEEMGNSADIIRRHYKSLVKPQAADAYWNLTPDTATPRGIVDMTGTPVDVSAAELKTA